MSAVYRVVVTVVEVRPDGLAPFAQWEVAELADAGDAVSFGQGLRGKGELMATRGTCGARLVPASLRVTGEVPS